MDFQEKYNEVKDRSDTGVQFHEYRPERSYSSKTPKIIHWVIKYSSGLVKDEKQALIVVGVFIALSLSISLYLLVGQLGGAKPARMDTINADIQLPAESNGAKP